MLIHYVNKDVRDGGGLYSAFMAGGPKPPKGGGTSKFKVRVQIPPPSSCFLIG